MAPSRKIKRMGRVVAAEEGAVHNAKLIAAGAAGDAKHATRRGAMSKMVSLLGSKQAQETAWLHCVSDPANFAARVPISEVTGVVPVDIWRGDATVYPTTNGSGQAFVMSGTDRWYNDTPQLHANGITAGVGAYTGATYGSSSFPTAGSLQTGTSIVPLGDLSSDFTASTDGTEYIQVASSLSLVAERPAAAATQGFVGNVYCYYTIDPQRFPIVGTSPATIIDASQKAGSAYSVAQYGITKSGKFFLKAVNGRPVTGPTVVASALHMFVAPLSVDAYKWQRITGNPVLNIPDKCVLGYFIDNPSGAVFKAVWTSVWQSERYPSARVVSGNFNHTDPQSRPEELGSLAYIMNGLVNGAQNLASGHALGTNSATYAPTLATIQNASKTPGFMNQLINQGSNALNGYLQGKALGDAYTSAKNWWNAGGKGVMELPQANPVSSGPIITEITESEAGRIPGLIGLPSSVAEPGGEAIPLMLEAAKPATGIGEQILQFLETAVEVMPK